MRESTFSLFLGLTATAVVLTPIAVEAATFDYSRVNNISARPIESNHILSLFGDQSQNQGYTAFSNEDPNAPDAGHVAPEGALPGGNVAYYTAGRHASPDPSDATRSASLENITGFSNFFNYINTNNISLSSIGFSYGPKSDLNFNKTWSLGEDKLGQDWFVSPDSTIAESIFQANPDDVEMFLSYGDTKLINFGYSDIYFISVNDSDSTFVDNLNIILSDPVPASKVASLDPLASGLADAFLQDVAAAGGSIQLVSEDAPELSDVSFSLSQGYEIATLSFPLELRAVSSKSVPEPSSILGFLMFGALGAATRMTKQKKSSF
jgi:hypothetical protein